MVFIIFFSAYFSVFPCNEKTGSSSELNIFLYFQDLANSKTRKRRSYCVKCGGGGGGPGGGGGGYPGGHGGGLGGGGGHGGGLGGGGGGGFGGGFGGT